MMIDVPEAEDNPESSATTTTTTTATVAARTTRKAVSVHYLATAFLNEVIETPDLSRASTIYEIENLDHTTTPGVIRQKGLGVICPRDGQPNAAYVDCLVGADNVGQATHMLSYSWGYTIGDIVDTLVEYCRTTNQDQKRTYIWICCLCINQHRVIASQTKGKRSGIGIPAGDKKDEVDFFAEFGDRVVAIGHVLVLMTPWNNPLYLNRIWCVYELYKAYCFKCKVTIVVPPEQKRALDSDLFGEGGKGIESLYGVLKNTQINKAESTVSSDRDTILTMVRKFPGDVVLNQTVNELLRGWVRQIINEIIFEKEKQQRPGRGSLDMALFYNRVADLLRRNGEHDAALDMAQKSHDILQGDSESIAPLKVRAVLAETYNNFGLAFAEKAMYDEAVAEHEKALLLEEEDIGKAKIYYFTGIAMHKKGDYEGALHELEKSLAIRESHLGYDHVDTAATYRNIGGVLQSKGDYKRALEHYRRALTIQETILGEHPDTAYTCQMIGSIHNTNYDYEDALVQYRRALEITESVLGKDHVDSAAIYNEIGWVFYKMGNYDAALEQVQLALEIQERVLGEYHPITAKTYLNIGSIMQDRDDHEGSLLWYEHALSIQESVLGKRHPATSVTHNNIGLVHFTLGRYLQALDEFRGALAIKESVMGEGNSATAMVRNRIGDCFRALGQRDKALVEYHKALAALEEDHVFVELIQDNIDSTQQDNSNPDS